MTISRILIANRGEIACRLIRSIKAMGKETVACASEADRDAPFVREADAHVILGPAPAAQSYLNMDALLRAAKDTGCDAVHPGYGFLSERAEFATVCQQAGLVFIGPSPDAMTQMGDKAAAREVATQAGVAPVPGYQGAQDLKSLEKGAKEVGYPLLVKAAKGGGGKGMRTVESPEGLADAVKAARREAEAAFGDGTLLLERRVFPARHIEVQVIADQHGNVASLFERECSLQRRHQKVIEECPGASVSHELRTRLGALATSLAKKVDYLGAGTVEFLVDEEENAWFLEMNTRLQVEHGVTELAIGEDLVEWQVRIAEGEALSERLMSPSLNGHAIEARIYAEDPEGGFLPQSGPIHALVEPRGPGIRVDSGIEAGQEVTPHYDPMLMKVLAHGADREQARRRLSHALEHLIVLGPATNHAWLVELLDSEMFQTAQTFTHTIEADHLPNPVQEIPDEVLALASAALVSRGSLDQESSGPGGGRDPFLELAGFRLADEPSR